jgi:hypothetical protein
MGRLVAGQQNERLLCFWEGGAERLRRLLMQESVVFLSLAWLDVNTLADDVIPRRAREVLRAALHGRIAEAVERGVHVLVIEQPYLLLRYEPAAPLAAFWDRFISSQRAVIIVLPAPIARPADLPSYVQFRGDDPSRLFAEVMVDAVLVSASGGLFA